MMCRSVIASLLVAMGASIGVDDSVAMMQRPMNPLEPHPDQKGDKARHKLKELQKHKNEENREQRLHENQVEEEDSRREGIESKKRTAMNEKENRQTEVKAAYRAMEEAEAKMDNDLKEHDYAERNARRAAHAEQRTKDEDVHRQKEEVVKATQEQAKGYGRVESTEAR